MRTHYVASIGLDEERLAKELDLSAAFHYSEAYSEYLCGGPWKSCMLWASGGDVGDGLITNYEYDRTAAFTDYGKQLPYLQELITEVFDLSRLTFARLARVSNSVIIPHRDLLELGDLPDDVRSVHRVHIPLATNENCFFGEGNTVYQMRRGEVWHLDASQIHSVAVLSQEPRVHLILDFPNTPGDGPMVKVGNYDEDTGVPDDRIVKRPPLPDDERAALLRLADVLTMDNFSEVFSIVIKKHFRFDGGENFAWNTLLQIARSCADPAVLPYVLDLHRYYTLERSA